MRAIPMLTTLLFCTSSALMAGAVLQPTPAPEWEVSGWLNDDPGSLRDHRGRVVLIGFFKLRCPGCEEFSLPLLQRWSEHYRDREVDLVFVHSVFAAPDYATLERLLEFVRETGISQPVGLDTYDDTGDDVPVTMRRYEARRTPHLAIVDREGMLRFTHFGAFDVEPVEWFIDRLLDEPPRSGRNIRTASVAEPHRPAADGDLSGAYVFQLDGATGPCAAFMPRMEVPAELRFYRDTIDVEFTEPLLGMEALEMLYDAASGHVSGEGSPVASGAAHVANQVMRLEGDLDAESDPPEMEFEISLANGKCSIPGRAVGEP